MICFFCRQNPETTFEVYVEVAYPRSGGTLSGICMFDYDMACLFIVWDSHAYGVCEYSKLLFIFKYV